MKTAILDIRPAVAPGNTSPRDTMGVLVRFPAPARRPAAAQRFFCHWRHGADGRLRCVWEPDTKIAAPAAHN